MPKETNPNATESPVVIQPVETPRQAEVAPASFQPAPPSYQPAPAAGPQAAQMAQIVNAPPVAYSNQQMMEYGQAPFQTEIRPGGIYIRAGRLVNANNKPLRG